LVARVVDLTGASVFPRENKAIALYAANGQALLDQRPTRFTSTAAIPPAPAAADTVRADGRIVDGRLGALLRLAADGSRQTPPQRPDPDPGAEIVRKLRSQLDAVTSTVLGRTRPNQPSSFADAYDSAPTATGQLIHGFFTGGTRRTLAVNPVLTSGTQGLKAGAAANVAASLTANRRQLSADGLPTCTSYGALTATVSGSWRQVSNLAVRDAKVADAANSLMTDQQPASGAIDLQTEVTKLQTLQTAQGSTQQVGHALSAFMAVLGQLAPA
jgi:flagellar hook-associated protein 1 FlgK